MHFTESQLSLLMNGEFMSDLSDLKKRLIQFREKRDWKQFHTLKNLMTALSIEVGELQELSLWKTDEEVSELLKNPEFKKSLESECADILNFLVMISDAGDFDLIEAANRKISKNDERYPADKAKGTAKKYSEL